MSIGGGSSTGATQVNQNYPTWSGPQIPTNFGDNTAYDTSEGTAGQIGTNFIPQYLAMAVRPLDDLYPSTTKYGHKYVTDTVAGQHYSVTINSVSGGSITTMTVPGLFGVVGEVFFVEQGSARSGAILVTATNAAGTYAAVTAFVIISGGSGYVVGGATVSFMPVPGTYPTLTGYSTVSVLNSSTIVDGGISDYITPLASGVPLATKYANMSVNESSAIAGLAVRGGAVGSNSETVITNGFTHIKDVFDGKYLDADSSTNGGAYPVQTSFNTMMGNANRNSGGIAKSDTLFSNSVRSKLTARLLTSFETDTHYPAQTMTDNDSGGIGTAGKNTLRRQAIIYENNYSAERGHQHDSLAMGIEYGDQDYINAESMRMCGLWNRQYLQGRLTDNYQILYENDLLRIKQHDILGQGIGGMIGMKSVVTRPYSRPNGWLSIAGGVLTGAATGNPLLAAAGGLLGGLSAASEGAQF